MQNNLKDLLEKSNSLPQSQRVHIKPIERVLYESNNLLNKLSKNVRSDEIRDFKGESLLVSKGFNVTSYSDSLKDINLESLSKIKTPSSELSLSSFLEKEESFLILSCLEECKNITSNSFYQRMSSLLDRKWEKEKDQKKSFKETKRTVLDKRYVEAYSSIVFEFLRTGKFEFEKYLSLLVDEEIYETYLFLENPNQKLHVYLENQYKRYFLRQFKKHGINVKNTTPAEKIIKYLNLIHKKEIEKNSFGETRWEILYYLMRIGEFDDNFVKNYFSNEIYDILTKKQSPSEHDKNKVQQEMKLIKNNFYKKVVLLLLYKLSTVKLNFLYFKIEDYIWFKCYDKHPLGPYEDKLKSSIVSKGLNYFQNSFLYFKLLLLVNDNVGALDVFEKKCNAPNSYINYVHFSVILYLNDKLPEDVFLRTIEKYTNVLISDYLCLKDALLYVLLIKNEETRIKKIKKILVQRFTTDFTVNQFKDLMEIMKRFIKPIQIKLILNQSEDRLSKNGEVFRSILLLFFMHKFFEDSKLLLKILERLNFLLYNSILNNEFEKKIQINKFSEEVINVIKNEINQKEKRMWLNNVNYKSFLLYLKLYKLFDLKANLKVINLIDVQGVGILPFSYTSVNMKVNTFLNSNFKIKSLYVKLLYVTFNIININAINEKEKMQKENLRKILILFVSKIQNHLPSSFFEDVIK